MTGAKKQTQPVGSVWELGKANAYTVVRPDGDEITVSDGLYVLSMPGVYTSGDNEMEAK